MNKVKLKIEIYSPYTQYAEGRIFFGAKGTYSTIKISGYLLPLVNLIKHMKIKHIIWNVQKEAIPDLLLPFMKPKKLAEMLQHETQDREPVTFTTTIKPQTTEIVMEYTPDDKYVHNETDDIEN